MGFHISKFVVVPNFFRSKSNEDSKILCSNQMGMRCDLFGVTHNFVICSMWIWSTLSLGHHAHDNESGREVTRCVNHTLHFLCDVVRRTSWEHVQKEVSVLPVHLARDLLLRVRAVCAPPSDSHSARLGTDTRQNMLNMCPCACCSDG